MPSDIELCRTTLRGGSRSFHAASLLLPKRIREPAAALYAFCRLADDAIDGGGDPAVALAEWSERLNRIYDGRPVDEAADRAFAAVVRQSAIPRALPDALLDGFRCDAQRRRYETLDELCDYAVRVAGTVGAMTTLLMGQRDPQVLARAIDLGVAMQLTNIARDVGEDARAGRLYLPMRWLREAGIDPDAFVERPAFDAALGSVVRQLLAAADILYRRAGAGIPALPASCRLGIQAARLLYAEIGHEVQRQGFDSVRGRAVVAPSRKLLVLMQAGGIALLPARDAAAQAIPEAQFLIDAIAASPSPATSGPIGAPWWQFGQRAVWVIDLFERMERREQMRRVSS